MAVVNACQAEDNILCQTARGNSPSELNSGESEGIYTLGESEEDKDMLAEDLANNQISVLARTFDTMTIRPYSPSEDQFVILYKQSECISGWVDSRKLSTVGVLEIRNQNQLPKWPTLPLQPDSRPISQEQLASEMKSIYTGFIIVEIKCI